MHELDLTRHVVKAVVDCAEREGASRVTRVEIEVGEVRDIVPDLMQKCFSYLAKDTAAADAELAFKIVPLTVVCNECGNVFGLSKKEGLVGRTCPRCGAANMSPLTGLELRIGNIEIV